MSTSEQPHGESSASTATERAWNTVVLNDPVNLQSYVVFVLRSHFGYDRDKAYALMMEVHTKGRSIVSRDGREKAESHVAAMHGYGLHAIMEEA